MKRILFSAAAVFVAVPLFAVPPAPVADKPAITALYQKLEAAMRNKDLKGLAALATPDFVQKAPNGRSMSGKQVLAQIEGRFKATKRVNNVEVKVRNLVINGKQATAVVDHKIAAVIIAQSKPRDLRSTGTTKDTLVKTAQGWKIKAIEAISESTTIDGEKLAPTSRPPAPPTRGRLAQPRR